MKKTITTLVLLLVLSVSVFAEGDILLGGKSCSPGQTCLTDGDVPTGGSKSDNSIYGEIFDFLKSIFE